MDFKNETQEDCSFSTGEIFILFSALRKDESALVFGELIKNEPTDSGTHSSNSEAKSTSGKQLKKALPKFTLLKSKIMNSSDSLLMKANDPYNSRRFTFPADRGEDSFLSAIDDQLERSDLDESFSAHPSDEHSNLEIGTQDNQSSSSPFGFTPTSNKSGRSSRNLSLSLNHTLRSSDCVHASFSPISSSKPSYFISSRYSVSPQEKPHFLTKQDILDLRKPVDPKIQKAQLQMQKKNLKQQKKEAKRQWEKTKLQEKRTKREATQLSRQKRLELGKFPLLNLRILSESAKISKTRRKFGWFPTSHLTIDSRIRISHKLQIQSVDFLFFWISNRFEDFIHNPELSFLLTSILQQLEDLANSDSGSIYTNLK